MMDTRADGPRDPDSMTLARYLSGEASAEESARVERWIDERAERRQLLDAMRVAWDRRPAAEFDPEDTVWGRIREQIGASAMGPALVREAQSRPTRPFQLVPGRGRWVAAAAVAAMAVGSALVGKRLLTRHDTGADIARSMREVATRRGERAVFDLADGSRVVLGAESRLRIPSDRGSRTAVARDLYLDGEGYFTVVHDGTRPFRVHTAAGVAEDIGTEYVVTTYPEVHGMRVVVASGAVALERGVPQPGGHPLVTLTSGDLATLDAAGTATLRRQVNLAPYLAWTHGTLVFDGTPLRDALPALARWYDLDIQLGDSALAAKKLTATFRDEPVAEVLRLISISLDLTVERRGRAVTFHGAKRP